MTFRKRLSSKQREELFHRLDGQCHICQQTIQRNERWEVSHVIPLELLGPDDASNRAPAHFKCHKWQTRVLDIPAIAKAKRIVRRERDFTRSTRPLPGGATTTSRNEWMVSLSCEPPINLGDQDNEQANY